MNAKVFVALSLFAQFGDEPIHLLKRKNIPYTLNPLGRRPKKEELIEFGKECEGIIAGVEVYDEEVLERLPHLQCISLCGVGIDNISLSKAKEKGITILNTPGVVIDPVAELTVAMILDLVRGVSFQSSMIKKNRWEKMGGHLLGSTKIGVLGLGRIGKRVCELLRKLDAPVYGADIRPDLLWAKAHQVNIVSTEVLLRECDVLSIHLSHLEGHSFCLGKNEISLMKKGAKVVNVSRGVFIDEDALFNALRDGYLSGAALDVFRDEPYRGKLCNLDNVILTPHIGSLTEESRLQMEIEATSNLLEYFAKFS